MTVAVAVKVFDGIVLAADSATTLALSGGSHQVYNNANKIFQLHRRKPIGLMTWGAGQISGASISTLAKDLRRRLMGLDPSHTDWELGDSFTVEAVAQRVVEMMHGELYSSAFATAVPAPVLGFLVAGFSAGEGQAEAWEVLLTDPATAPKPVIKLDKAHSGWTVAGQPEAAGRLWNGCDPVLQEAVMTAVSGTPAEAHVKAALGAAARNPAVAAMPFADAIDLAKSIVTATVDFVRYSLGPDTVGGPVEVAGIARHEGFRWVARKHYYSVELNREDHHHDH